KPWIYTFLVPWNNMVTAATTGFLLMLLAEKRMVNRGTLALAGTLLGWTFMARSVDVVFCGLLAFPLVRDRDLWASVQRAAWMALPVACLVLLTLAMHKAVLGAYFATPYLYHLHYNSDITDANLGSFRLLTVPRNLYAVWINPLQYFPLTLVRSGG